MEKSRQLPFHPTLSADAVASDQQNLHLSQNHPDWAFSHSETVCMIQLLTYSSCISSKAF